MADGIHRTTKTVDSTSPILPHLKYDPTNVRDVLQRQIQHTVKRDVDVVREYSEGNLDGRFGGDFPSEEQPLTNPHGRFYHIVGVSKGGDLSVAAP